MRDLRGKVAVVTGAASGIGLALARRLGREPMRVVLADVETEALRRAHRLLADEGIEVESRVTDVSDAADLERLAAYALDRFGAVHVVCNNAGVGGGGLTWEVPLNVWRWVVDVNLFGVVHGIRAFVPHLLRQGEGHVVNTASVAGLLAGPGLSPYTAAKHAVVGLSESLYHELQLVGSAVRVSVLCPGFVRTRIAEAQRNWLARYGPPPLEPRPEEEATRRRLEEAIASGLEPEAVAEAVRSAILEERFWVLTHPEFGEAVIERARRAATGRDPAPPGGEVGR
ncbi:MAG TPA: SDR family NAD(P)-dependent oxidoreductase [Candidatus Dormibacteraeota bacterium]|nr:SDR family NAD(P)-dependent oxidoreductase [Candidatus Dormibacteraeota bacterium]